jgi:hypothetical protein
MAIRGLDASYETILKHFGAAGRILKENGNARTHGGRPCGIQGTLW